MRADHAHGAGVRHGPKVPANVTAVAKRDRVR